MHERGLSAATPYPTCSVWLRKLVLFWRLSSDTSPFEVLASQAAADTTPCVKSTLRGINCTMDGWALHYERHSTRCDINLETPLSMERCTGPQRPPVLSMVAPGAICSGLSPTAQTPLPLFRLLASGFPWGFFFFSLASPCCDRRFTFHNLGELPLSLRRYYTKTGNEKGIATLASWQGCKRER